MPAHGDYLPHQEAVLIDWGDNFGAEITAHGTDWEIPAAEIAGVATALDAFKALHKKAPSGAESGTLLRRKSALW
jgi:hypothetical protein